MDPEDKKARVIKANYLLQAKVGMGPVDEKLIAKSQKLIDSSTTAFEPIARQYIEALEQAILDAKQGGQDDQVILQSLIEPIMQLKANVSMSDYQLVGSLANIMLNFLETVKQFDNNVLEIVEAHQKTIVTIINNNMKGDGGAFGKELTTELKDACKRYFAKKASGGDAIDDVDAFFIDG